MKLSIKPHGTHDHVQKSTIASNHTQRERCNAFTNSEIHVIRLKVRLSSPRVEVFIFAMGPKNAHSSRKTGFWNDKWKLNPTMSLSDGAASANTADRRTSNPVSKMAERIVVCRFFQTHVFWLVHHVRPRSRDLMTHETGRMHLRFVVNELRYCRSRLPRQDC